MRGPGPLETPEGKVEEVFWLLELAKVLTVDNVPEFVLNADH